MTPSHLTDEPIAVNPWLLPVLVIALVVPAAIAWLAIGPTVGILVVGAVAVVVALVAIRQAPKRPLGRRRRR